MLLPSIHQAWSPIVSRLKEILIIVQYYYGNFGSLNRQNEKSPSKVGNIDKSLLALESTDDANAVPLKLVISSEKKTALAISLNKTISVMNRQDSLQIDNPLYEKSRLHLYSRYTIMIYCLHLRI